ncbi:hypothetical protein RIF29_00717 [Crotalaria pallida]|uniref:Uncharacterized protein n=1 Tax=Crotalaria pallida TaxID=3830 RepID=A0AAN9IXU3_CROPI
MWLPSLHENRQWFQREKRKSGNLPKRMARKRTWRFLAKQLLRSTSLTLFGVEHHEDLFSAISLEQKEMRRSLALREEGKETSEKAKEEAEKARVKAKEAKGKAEGDMVNARRESLALIEERDQMRFKLEKSHEAENIRLY